MPTQNTLLPQTLLSAVFTGVFSADYFRTDDPISGNQGIRQNLRYGDLKTLFNNGDGDFLANLLYDERITIDAGSIRLLNINSGLLNKFGQELNINAIKLLIVRNRSSLGPFKVILKQNQNTVMPEGAIIMIAPLGAGLDVTIGASSSSSEEGTLQLDNSTGVDSVECDVIILGSRFEQSSSSGL